MARLRRGEGHENTSQPLPPVPEASIEKVSERENSEPPTFPSYPTLELDLCDVQAFMPETDAASTQPDGEMDGCQGFEVWRLDLPAFLEPEESTLPGYLTLEIDLNALGDVASWKSSSNAASDEPRGKV
jgi:hypothetical protein